MKRAQRELYPLVEDLIFDAEIPQECGAAFQKIMIGLQNLEYWAISFAGSSGGLPSFLEGNYADLGNYDACVSSTARDSEGEIAFTGRYCTLLLNVYNPLLEKILINAAETQPHISDLFFNNTDHFVEFSENQYLRIGICIPSTCRGENIEYAVEKPKCYVRHSDIRCLKYSQDFRKDGNSGSLFRSAVILILVALCVLGSFFDAQEGAYTECKGGMSSRAREIVRCFSIQSSWTSVFDFEVRPNDKYLACVHGIRALTAIYIIWCHVYSVVDPLSIQNGALLIRWSRYDISFVPVYMGVLTVDTFFCISGAMTLRTFYKGSQKKKGSLLATICSDLLRRWIRLAIPSVAIIGLYTMMFFIVSGPLKDFAEPFFWGRCEEIWWTIPTMLSNVNRVEDSCLLHLWYVGADFQLRVLFILPVIAIASRSKFRAVGIVFAGAMGLASVLYVSLTTYYNKIIPAAIPSPRLLPHLLDMYYYVHSTPFTRLASFALGVGVMFVIEEQRSGKMKAFPRSVMLSLHIGIPLISVINFYLPYYWQLGGDPWTVWSALYAGLVRGIWSLGVSWLIYICAMGCGGAVNWILTLRALVPISRLSFSIYLIHILVLEVKLLQMRGTHEPGHYLQTITALGLTLLSIFCAFIFYSLVENPVANLLELFRRKNDESSLPHTGAEKLSKNSENQLKQNKIPLDRYCP
ncbi:nose resistant to fluoxetine protein 6 [Galendromus occidentalis]|uniref:Nose resistant to fluoxetine protein 6 n=1 Tax=Galendromus occidentalis TaxID=34638 RepID=A0AAJ6QRP9_9ACAR|nr:nose resistant to fluoxetine protein 6 [Galendromus occidentalis]